MYEDGTWARIQRIYNQRQCLWQQLQYLQKQLQVQQQLQVQIGQMLQQMQDIRYTDECLAAEQARLSYMLQQEIYIQTQYAAPLQAQQPTINQQLPVEEPVAQPQYQVQQPQQYQPQYQVQQPQQEQPQYQVQQPQQYQRQYQVQQPQQDQPQYQVQQPQQYQPQYQVQQPQQEQPQYQVQQPQQEQTLQQEDNSNQQLSAERQAAQSDISQQLPSQGQADVVENQIAEVKSELQQVNAITIDEFKDDKNALPVKSAAERIRELPVYDKLEDLQKKIKEIFKDCTITVDGKQRPVSDYFEKFKPATSSVVFWSRCDLGKVKDIAVSKKIAKKLTSTTLSMVRDSKRDGIKLCDYVFKGDMIVNTEFDVESSFLAAQQLGTAYFISNENVSVGGVWEKYELPILLRNPSVKQIIRIDASIYCDIKDLDPKENAQKIRQKTEGKSRIVFDREKHSKFDDPDEVNRLCQRILDIKSIHSPQAESQVDSQTL